MKSNTCILDNWLMQKLKVNLNELQLALKEEQLRLIQQTFFHSKQKSSFYKKHFKNLELNTWADFYKLPFTCATDLQYEQMLCVSQSEIERIVTLQSSGTTATPKRIAFSKQDLNDTVDFFTVGMSQIVQSGQRLLVLWPGAMRPYGVSALLRVALQKNNIDVFAGTAQCSKASLMQELETYNPHVIVAAPCQLEILAEMLTAKPVDNLALNAVLASAECLSYALEQRLQQFGLLVLDHYGITEAGYGGGVECLHKNGYHLRELNILVEIIDPISLKPAEDGCEGEVVISTLTRHAMPLMRYRTGDVASMLSGPCACGSPLRRLSKIKGRLEYTQNHYIIKNYPKGLFYERTINATL